MRRLTILLLLALPASGTELPFPQTFRRDLADDRSYEFGDRYFLDVASFRFLEDWDRRAETGGNRYRGTGGSISSDEFYLVQEARYRKALDDRWGFGYRFLQDQDFDGPLVKNLIQLDYGTERWRIGPVAEMDQFKQDLDLGMTGEWMPSKQHAFRAWAFFVDPLFNEKTSGRDSYERRAVTGSLEGRHRFSDRLSAGWAASYLPPVTLVLATRGFTFHSRQLFWRGDLAWTPAEDRRIRLEASGEETHRSRDYTSPADPLTFRQGRNVQRARASWTQGKEGRALRLGLEYVGFLEWNEFLQNHASTYSLSRREVIASVGLDRALSGAWTARPTVFLAKLQNREDHALSPSAERRNTGFESKAALAFERRFQKGARLLVNPTVLLDGFGFGGGNLQCEVEF